MYQNYEDDYKSLSNEDYNMEDFLNEEGSFIGVNQSLKKMKNVTNSKNISVERKVGKWTEEEDEFLKILVNEFGGKNWKKIAEHMKQRSPIQCLHRWTKILQPGLIKGSWVVQEDKKLIEWVQREGPTKWSQCAELISGRNGKQCRERWFNSLNPIVKKGNWKAEEDFNLFYYYKKLDGKWANIAVHFEGRTENSLKNRFFSTLRRICSEQKKDTSIKNETNSPDFSEYSNVSHVGLEELKKLIPVAEESIKFKLMKENNLSQYDLNIFEIKLNETIISSLKKNQKKANNNYSNYNSTKTEKQSPIEHIKQNPTIPANYDFNFYTTKHEAQTGNTYNLNVNINQNNNGNFIVNAPPVFDMNQMNNNSNYNLYKSMDIYNLEKDIAEMCDNSLFFPEMSFNLDNQLDNLIENMFSNNNILMTSDPLLNCESCPEKPIMSNPYINSEVDNSSSINNMMNNFNFDEVFKMPLNNSINNNNNNSNIIKTSINNSKNVASPVQTKDPVYKLKCDNGKNKNEVFQNLLSQLNGLEKLVKNAKKELTKYEKQETSDDQIYQNFNIDNLFKF